jgi:hypothetical protein
MTFNCIFSDIRSIQRRENEQTVAFFAYLTNHIDKPGVHQIIAFDHVTTNIGNGYNAFAGDFRYDFGHIISTYLRQFANYDSSTYIKEHYF